MADKLQFSLVSPEREVLNRAVDQVDIPATEGWIGVLPDHAPLMTTLSPGMIRVVNGGEEQRVFIRGGFAEITPGGLTVLAEEARRADELTAAEVDEELARAEREVEEAGADEDRIAARTRYERLRELRAAL